MKNMYLCELIFDGYLQKTFFREGSTAKDVLDDLLLFQWPAGEWRITLT
jgi:hypothetical protein